jgi:L-threonylcarbamoyladenylate synthase
MDAQHLKTVRRADTAAITEAAALIRRGGLVAFPTETVYGLGADATNSDAVARIFAAKRRPHINPLIVHVASLAAAEALTAFSKPARALAEAFWPGPLTLVLPRRPDCPLSLLVSAGLDTVALRVPAHRTAVALLKESGRPIAAPSANTSGRITATSASHVAKDLAQAADLILDDGRTPLGIESTVIGWRDGQPVVLRPGAIARDAIEGVTGKLGTTGTTQVQSPGQLASHYAPRAKLRLDANAPRADEAFLAFGPSTASSTVSLNLSPGGDLREAAANLFAMLRKLDAANFETIAVMPIPDTGLGEAINDRLRRAAAPRAGAE